MSLPFTIGRILLVLIFILSGAQKLMDVNAAAAMISGKVVVPQALAGFATQVEGATGLSTPQLLAIASAVVELIGGILVAFNVGVRWAALMLLLFTIAVTFYMHDFWNMAGEQRMDNIIHALKNVSIIGGLLVFVAIGTWRPLSRPLVEGV
jgi:uncharacterized membrane protein YphA (DoxX/SURF4 family)